MDSEVEAAGDEESAATLVSVALPAERRRILGPLELIPRAEESKTLELLRALGDLWAVHPGEKIVVFTTYLGSVDALKAAIDQRFPEAGVEVLKGRRPRSQGCRRTAVQAADGPRVLICTAAGREGINLQFARVLFNHDLPWNPMDVEQRIGRIHRYGQQHTAQVYNLVSADTIEGRIFLMLEEKLLAIGKALGKVDEYGQVTEDLREQVLGQLSERLSYDKLYQDALKDPTLRRTRQELEVALENATHGPPGGFRAIPGPRQLPAGRLQAVRRQRQRHGAAAPVCPGRRPAGRRDRSSPRAIALRSYPERRGPAAPFHEPGAGQGRREPLALGLGTSRGSPADGCPSAAWGRGERSCRPSFGRWHVQGAVTIWRVESHSGQGQVQQRILTIGLTPEGERSRPLERLVDQIHDLQPSDQAVFDTLRRAELVRSAVPEMIRRELAHAGVLTEDTSFSARLLAWVEVA